MSTTSACANPMCTCNPCGCDDCTCGVSRLGELERWVMEILWESADSEVSVRDVAGALPEYAYTTVATILDRLVRKGLLKRRMDGRTIRFAAIGSEGAHTAVLMRKALGEDSDPDAALLCFVAGLSDSEASVLRRALNRLDRKARG
ncbi:MAG: BlaI/MecI/CopY family transcriptional regulator [Acidimicrobiales bacterium]|jgi:predicted transcriptional regulator